MIARLLCRILGHQLRFAEFDPITITHAMHCDRCGLHGWPNEYVDNLTQGEDMATKNRHLCPEQAHAAMLRALEHGDWPGDQPPLYFVNSRSPEWLHSAIRDHPDRFEVVKLGSDIYGGVEYRAQMIPRQSTPDVGADSR